MIYKLFRKEVASRNKQLMSKTSQNESQFMEYLALFVKLIKKKEILYLRILEEGDKTTFLTESGNDVGKEFEKLYQEGVSIQCKLNSFREEDFFFNKAYLYTAFMRVKEVLQAQLKRFKAQNKPEIALQFEQTKNTLTTLYSDLLFYERFDLMQVVNFMSRNQNRRIGAKVPRRTLSTTLEPINRSNKLLQKLKQPRQSYLRKTISVQLNKNGQQSKLEDIVKQKLVIKSLATEKCLQERKVYKGKKGVNLFSLYSGLNLRPFRGDFRLEGTQEQLEKNMIDRNKGLKEMIKQFEKKCISFNSRKKDIK